MTWRFLSAGKSDEGAAGLTGEGVHTAMKRRRCALLLGLGLSMMFLITAGQVYAALVLRAASQHAKWRKWKK